MKLVVLVFVALLVVAPSAAASDRASAYEQWLTVRSAADVPAGWTGSAASCAVGTESAASVAATLTAVNGLRALAGLAPVTFDPALNREALGAALSLAGCPSEAAGHSLLASARSGADAVLSYTAALPHRLFLLDRATGAFGTGSTGSAHALLFATGARVAPSGPTVVSWPPAGWLPTALVPEEWSAEFPPGTDLSGATVNVSVGGAARAVSGVRVVTDGYGGPALAWKVALAPDDREIDVVAGGHGYRVSTFVADTPLPVAVRASHAGNVVTVAWDAAVERGVPVTGYRVQVAGLLDVTLGPEARSTSFTATAGGASIRVTPLSRAGSPRGLGTSLGWITLGGDKGPPETSPPTETTPEVATPGTAAPGVIALGGGVTAKAKRAPTILRARIIAVPPKAGSRLVADIHIRDAKTIRFQWLRNGRAIRGATHRTYTARRADRRHAIRLRITAIGTTTVVRTTAAVRIRT
ncbi:hypothetical protein OJ998_14015 [Solirubrobacter taibaiensis]|nr:hypothetical protein [Solirubrobacter taibaiensis]